MGDERFVVELADGRVLDPWVSGPQDGVAAIFHHGTPMSGLPFGPFEEAATSRGIRLVSYSRPGYGGSTRAPGRSVADCAEDVAAILDRLEVEHALTLGWSGGGPHTLATAALLPDRVIACATIAGAGPYGEPDLDFMAGMGQENLEEFGAAVEGPGPLRTYLEPEGATLRRSEPTRSPTRSAIWSPTSTARRSQVTSRRTWRAP
jgi:pimeloyl-ACP methyl ester carboxylesterase